MFPIITFRSVNFMAFAKTLYESKAVTIVT